MDGFNDSEPRALTWAASSSLHKPDIYAGDAKHDEGADPPGSFPGQSIYSISVKGTINVRRLSLSGRHFHLWHYYKENRILPRHCWIAA